MKGIAVFSAELLRHVFCSFAILLIELFEASYVILGFLYYAN